jgi:hypothetical protein
MTGLLVLVIEEVLLVLEEVLLLLEMLFHVP